VIQKLRLYQPHEVQSAFHASPKRYRIASLGRQSGKSTMAINELARKAWINPETRYWMIEPIYSQARDMYRRLCKLLPHGSFKGNDSELRVELINKSTIEFKSGETLDNLRGASLHGVVIDEVRDQHAELWPLVIRPMLTTTNGWAAFISTPSGYDQFYDLWDKAGEDWDKFKSPSTCNPLFTKEEYEASKREMSEAEFDQEINANFRDLQKGRAYYAFSEENISDVHLFAGGNYCNPYLPVELYMDFNVHHMGWTLSQFRNGTGHYFFDEIYGYENTTTAAKEFVHRFKHLGISANPGVILVGDSTGKANKTSAAGQTDYTIIYEELKRAGITFEDRTPDTNPHVKDRVQTMNTRFKAGDGTVSIWVNPRCKYLIRDFQRVVWKEATSGAILDQVRDRSLTHLSDGAGYGVMVRHPVTSEGHVGTLRMVRR
jgi:hypothetical protein